MESYPISPVFSSWPQGAVGNVDVQFSVSMLCLNCANLPEGSTTMRLIWRHVTHVAGWKAKFYALAARRLRVVYSRVDNYSCFYFNYFDSPMHSDLFHTQYLNCEHTASAILPAVSGCATVSDASDHVVSASDHLRSVVSGWVTRQESNATVKSPCP